MQMTHRRLPLLSVVLQELLLMLKLLVVVAEAAAVQGVVLLELPKNVYVGLIGHIIYVFYFLIYVQPDGCNARYLLEISLLKLFPW